MGRVSGIGGGFGDGERLTVRGGGGAGAGGGTGAGACGAVGVTGGMGVIGVVGVSFGFEPCIFSNRDLRDETDF